MKRLFLAAALAAAITVSASAQTPSGTPQAPAPVAIGGPIGSPTFVVPQKQGGVINVGQAFSEVAEPYVNAAINALILAVLGWAFAVFKQKTGIAIDQGHRDALVRALQNQAGSLIDDGFVRVEGATVTVPNEQLAAAANEIIAVLPDAAAHFGLTPEYVAKRIIDFIPQTTAGAAIIAASPTAKAGS
jgi:hypothetical protein